MALARVVSFEGVSRDRIKELEREMREGVRPEDSRRPRFSCCTIPMPRSRS